MKIKLENKSAKARLAFRKAEKEGKAGPDSEKRKKTVAGSAPNATGAKQTPGPNLRMVEVGEKPETLRTAEARGEVRVSPEVMKRLLEGSLPKGDVLTAARLAGIQAAKKTPELVPLCHPLRLTAVEVETIPQADENLVEVRSRVRAVDRTGVEMEALTAVAVACLTIYDMCKAFDKRMVISDIHLQMKSGGKSGEFHWEEQGKEAGDSEKNRTGARSGKKG